MNPVFSAVKTALYREKADTTASGPQGRAVAGREEKCLEKKLNKETYYHCASICPSSCVAVCHSPVLAAEVHALSQAQPSEQRRRGGGGDTASLHWHTLCSGAGVSK